MKNSLKLFMPLLAILFLSGCSVVGGIFKAGVWVGVIAVVIVIVLIFLLVSRSKK